MEKMPVRLEENAETNSYSPPAKKIRISVLRIRKVKKFSRSTEEGLVFKKNIGGSPRTRMRKMMNGYIPGESQNKSSTDDSPCSEANGFCPVATLHNLGNTCFLNSVLYTLRFAPFFLHKLHHLVNDLNELNTRYASKTKSSSLGRNIGSNPKNWGSGNKDGLAIVSSSNNVDTKPNCHILSTEELHDLYEFLHSSEMKGDMEPYHPISYLQSLRNVNPIFEGNGQHDAHELLVCLLDNVRESSTMLDRLTKQQDRLQLESPNGIGVQLDLALSHPPPIHVPIHNSSRPTWRKSWKKRKERTIAMEVAEVIRENGDTNGSNAVVNGLSTLKQLSLIAEDTVTNTTSSTDNSSHEGDSHRTVLGSVTVDKNCIADDFEGLSVLMTTCLECETTTVRKEAFCDICVPITTERRDDDDSSDCDSTTKTVSSMFQSAIVTSEYLRDGNKYWCSNCMRLNEARRSVRYETLPRLLILQLKRFSSTYSSIVSVSKINDYMPTPLTLACFCEECLNLPEEKRPHRYELYGIIMHLGASIVSGHYVAYVKATDSTQQYQHCKRDKRKTASMGYSKVNCDKVGGFFKFFRQKSSTNTDMVAKQAAANHTDTCQSLDCCGVKLNRLIGESSRAMNSDVQNGFVDGKDVTITDSSTDTFIPEPIWLECDDDCIRSLTLREFEDILSPDYSKKERHTPYLLFYARSP